MSPNFQSLTYGDKSDGVDALIAEVDRDGVMEHQEKHQLRLQQCFRLLIFEAVERNNRCLELFTGTYSYSNYAATDYSLWGGSLAIVLVACRCGRAPGLCLDVRRGSANEKSIR